MEDIKILVLDPVDLLCYDDSGMVSFCLPKVHVLKTWSPDGHTWEEVVPLRGGTYKEVFRLLEA